MNLDKIALILALVLASSTFAQYGAGTGEYSSSSDGEDEEIFFFTKRKYAQRHHWYWGVGAVVSDLPVVKSRFKLPFSQILYEYNVGDLNSSYRAAIGGGFYGLNAVLPVPALQGSFYLGSENNDVMGRLSAGAFSDVTVGGHSGALFSAGVVIKNRLDFSLIIVPFGTQPVVPYSEILGDVEEEFVRVEEVDYAKDPFGKNLVVYDASKRHPGDDRYHKEADYASEQRYYSSYDMEYGNANYANNLKSHPGEFDYVKGREYITFPYFGIMVTFRH